MREDLLDRARQEAVRLRGEDASRDLAWSYPTPIAEASKIADKVAFFNERVDVWVDGELQGRPQTVWS